MQTEPLTDNDLVRDVQRHYVLTLGQDQDTDKPSKHYLYQALALAIRDRLMERHKATRRREKASPTRRVHYLSLEFLMGRALTNAVHALSLEDSLKSVLLEFGVGLEAVADAEQDAGLGNGGLGRLAACFLDSCATLELPVTGYGMRYEYGMFRQQIQEGEQVEYPDPWLRDGNPWEIERAESIRRVRFGGRTDLKRLPGRTFRVEWKDTRDVLAVPYDVMIPGDGGQTVNRLRLWKAAASTDEFDLEEFNAGSYPEAIADKNQAENITMVLYPNDVSENGKVLRLRQQYFLASASLQDVVAEHLKTNGGDISNLSEYNVFQLNDTHPSFAVPELMRILLDDHGFGWDEAWETTSSCMAYTNHTLLPEALEKWPVRLFDEWLPRLLEIIYEINARFLQQVSMHWPGEVDRLERMSLIEEGPVRMVRMAHLAVVGSFSVNGVAALHSRLLTEDLFRDFYLLWPERFNNKTNGVTPRRWIRHANPGLSSLVTSAIGDVWHRDLEALRGLASLRTDAAFVEQWQLVKLENKRRLANRIRDRVDAVIDPEWLLDVQVKRIHEYKRQLLNVLHVLHLYDRIHRGDGDSIVPRTVIFGGKAAPGYLRAKRIIHLINCVGNVVNKDPLANRRLRVVFVPNYDVTSMEFICPAAELSEQISTAGKEASGTGNMKLMMNGALTIGTLDGANIEIREQVGDENFFAFGHTAEEAIAMAGHHDPAGIIAADEDLRRVLELIDSGMFSLFADGDFGDITGSIRRRGDPWIVAADFRSYVDAQGRVESCYLDRAGWQAMSIANTAGSGRFSSDRTISEYARDIWKVTAPVVHPQLVTI